MFKQTLVIAYISIVEHHNIFTRFVFLGIKLLGHVYLFKWHVES